MVPISHRYPPLSEAPHIILFFACLISFLEPLLDLPLTSRAPCTGSPHAPSLCTPSALGRRTAPWPPGLSHRVAHAAHYRPAPPSLSLHIGGGWRELVVPDHAAPPLPRTPRRLDVVRALAFVRAEGPRRAWLRRAATPPTRLAWPPRAAPHPGSRAKGKSRKWST
jgi:hypothetical protein